MRGLWERYDKPVQDGLTSRSWTWGPNTYGPFSDQPFSLALFELYEEAPGGIRRVLYFDKSRMEITNPDADPNSPWFVTNGLLATELVTGQLQLGDNRFVFRGPAQIPIAGDPDDSGGPFYSTFTSLVGQSHPRMPGGTYHRAHQPRGRGCWHPRP